LRNDFLADTIPGDYRDLFLGRHGAET